MTNTFLKILLLLFILSIKTSFAQNTKFKEGLCNFEEWENPLWSDMNSTLIKLEIAQASNSPEYDLANTGKPSRTFAFANIGSNIPLWGGDFKEKSFSLKITLPFSTTIWMDLFEPTTSPIINTDYRIGAPTFALIQRFSTPRLNIKNYAIKLSPFKHESTHIGDELTIMRKQANFPVTRVNVSFNYAELNFVINDPDGSRLKNNTFKFGVMCLLNPSKGWYSIRKIEGDTTKVIPSDLPLEIYFQHQYQTRTYKNNLQGISSLEIRNRVLYNYPSSYYVKNTLVQTDNNTESRAWSANYLIGLRYNNPKAKGYFSKIGFGIRFYTGLNPYGQFRSQLYYSQLGAFIIFE